MATPTPALTRANSAYPTSLLPFVIFLEIVGGLCIAAGWQTRLGALVLAAFCLLAAALFHANLADRNQLLHFEKDLAIAEPGDARPHHL